MKGNYKVCNTCKKEPGTCSSCRDNPLGQATQGESMKDTDKLFMEAFGRSRREILDEKASWSQTDSPMPVMQIDSKTGVLVETSQSIRNRKACETSNKPYSKPIFESKSISQRFSEAFE